MAEANGLGVIPYSPAAGGLLSGKYVADATGRLTTNKMYQTRYGEAWVHEVAARFADFCRGRGLHPVSVAVAWVAAHPAVTAPIIGGRSVKQLPASLAPVKIDLSPSLPARSSPARAGGRPRRHSDQCPGNSPCTRGTDQRTMVRNDRPHTRWSLQRFVVCEAAAAAAGAGSARGVRLTVSLSTRMSSAPR